MRRRVDRLLSGAAEVQVRYGRLPRHWNTRESAAALFLLRHSALLRRAA